MSLLLLPSLSYVNLSIPKIWSPWNESFWTNPFFTRCSQFPKRVNNYFQIEQLRLALLLQGVSVVPSLISPVMMPRSSLRAEEGGCHFTSARHAQVTRRESTSVAMLYLVYLKKYQPTSIVSKSVNHFRPSRIIIVDIILGYFHLKWSIVQWEKFCNVWDQR